MAGVMAIAACAYFGAERKLVVQPTLLLVDS